MIDATQVKNCTVTISLMIEHPGPPAQTNSCNPPRDAGPRQWNIVAIDLARPELKLVGVKYGALYFESTRLSQNTEALQGVDYQVARRIQLTPGRPVCLPCPTGNRH